MPRWPSEVGPGDLVVIPAGVTQRIASLGDEELVFYCICTPRFTPECYETLGDQAPAGGARRVGLA